MAIRRVLSTEDGNLQKSTLISSRTVDYLDIDLTFNKKPAGDIYKKRDAAAVKQSIKNLLLTDHYEKPFNPFFGANLRGMLFELDTTDSIIIEDNIKRLIGSYEPRARVDDVLVSSRGNDLNVSLYFTVQNDPSPHELDLILTRVR